MTAVVSAVSALVSLSSIFASCKFSSIEDFSGALISDRIGKMRMQIRSMVKIILCFLEKGMISFCKMIARTMLRMMARYGVTSSGQNGRRLGSIMYSPQ